MFNLSHSTYHIEHDIRHYEAGFSPQSYDPSNHQDMTEFRRCAFTPTVYREPTKLESIERYQAKYKSEANKREMKLTSKQYVDYRIMIQPAGGYRAHTNVVGLEDSGFVDIDMYKEDSAGKLPTQENVSKALKDKGILNIVFRSGSNHPNKLRVLYKRGFKLYYKHSYDPKLETWDLSIVQPKKRDIISTHPEVFSTKRTSMPNVISSILNQELTYVAEILADAGINTSGIDPTSCGAHMHSAHCIRDGMDDYPEPTMFLDGRVI